ncbi:MAG: hypothetical protein RIQ81_942 [Pseudomonadota bacterium]|jgi:UDP-N-acetylglucosamine--N-acetylmuramyl-(pentapeptide) pyrophosphoryl-undecaprenol N-acetylglucosamine transferase
MRNPVVEAKFSANNLVLLTGGGTAGHVMPNLALVPVLRASGFRVEYVGSQGLEADLVARTGLVFHRISSGKLRRYASIENFFDVFRVIAGLFQAIVLMIRLRPACVFSKGGFVAVPVAIGAWITGVPVISHESDVSPGLANRIISRFARINLFAFPETARFFGSRPARLAGIPVRPEILAGNRDRGLARCGWGKDHSSLPVVLFMGGSQGAKFINDLVFAALPDLLKSCRIVHLTGRGKQDGFSRDSLPSELRGNYQSFEFLNEELADVLAAADLVVCRAGANSIFELRALRKPMILIPLEKGSRGDQILNAESFRAQGEATVLREGEASANLLASMVLQQIQTSAPTQVQGRSDDPFVSAEQVVLDEIKSAVRGPG